MNKPNKLLFPELSYEVNGVLFKVHNELGRFCREKDYGNLVEKYLKEKGLKYRREVSIDIGNNIIRIDFIIEESIALELKAKKLILRDDYYQLKRYLIQLNCSLGIIVNFQDKYLKPRRVLNSQAPF